MEVDQPAANFTSTAVTTPKTSGLNLLKNLKNPFI